METKVSKANDKGRIPLPISDQSGKWARLFDDAGWGIVVGCAESTTLELMDPAFAQMHGYTVEELAGRPIAEVLAPGERLKIPEYTRILNEKGHYSYESMHLRKDGSVFPVIVDAAAIKDKSGNISYRAVHVRDVSGFKRNIGGVQDCGRRLKIVARKMSAEKDLQDREQRYLHAEEMGQLGHWQRNLADGTVSWSRGIYRIVGRDPAHFDPIWENFIQLIYPEDREIVKNFMQTAVRTGDKAEIEYRIVRPDGSLRVVHSIVEFRKDPERKPASMFGLLRDVTELREKERLLKDRERQLEYKTAELEDINAALRVLLKNREEDRKKLKGQVLGNIKELVEPYLAKLKRSGLSRTQKSYLDVVDRNLREAAMQFADKVSSRHYSLTHMELQVANLVMQGKTSKEISELLNLSWQTINTHRKNIRKKMGLRNKAINLRMYLLSNLNG